MLNIATRTQKSLLKACRGAHKRGARSGDNGNRDQLNFRSYTSTSTRSTLRSSSTHLFVIGSLAFGASAVFYALNCPTMRSKAETEEASATPAPKPTISQLTAGSAYIVGDCVMPGKLDNEPMLMPHAILLKAQSKSVSIGDDEAWVVDASGKLHSWSKTNAPSPNTQLRSYSFKQVSCGSDGFVALLQTNGSIWIRFKTGDDFVLINKGDLRKKTVSKLSAGANHVAAITTDGSLYTLGNNERGQCGVQELKQSPVDTPHLVSWRGKFTDVATGLYHTVAITEDGNVVGFGYNKNLQLGKPQEWVQYRPPSVPLVPFGSYTEVRESEQARFNAKNWVDTTEYISQYAHSVPAISDYFTKNQIKASRVVCGDEFTFVFDNNGALYGFGDGSRGQLARNPARSYGAPSIVRREPFAGDSPSDIATMSCGSAHCMALTKNGDLWTWGSNQNGECARQSKVFTPSPTKVPVDGKITITNVICSKSASVLIL